MNIRIVKIDLGPVVEQLARIATVLEHMVASTDPVPQGWEPPNPDSKAPDLYISEEEQIVREKLARMGREYDPRKAKRY